MAKQYSVAAAKNQLPAVLHEVESGAAIEITRHGKAIAVLLSVGEYRRLHNGKPDLWEAYQAWRARSGGLDDSDVEAWLSGTRDASPGGAVEW
jgi:prevent-host-death family protein